MRGRSLIATTALIALAQLLAPGLTSARRAKPRPRPRPLTLAWVGDIALSSERGLPAGGLTHALAPARRLLRASDLTLGNLEGTLSVGGASKCGGNARAFAHAVINAGASIVLGSGPHVIRGIERYRGRLIAYSLGNFVGYHTLAGGGVLSESGILRVTLGPRGRVLGCRWISLNLDGGLPRRDRTNASARLVRMLSREDFGRRRFAIAPNGAIGPPGGQRRHHVHG